MNIFLVFFVRLNFKITEINLLKQHHLILYWHLNLNQISNLLENEEHANFLLHEIHLMWNVLFLLCFFKNLNVKDECFLFKYNVQLYNNNTNVSVPCIGEILIEFLSCYLNYFLLNFVSTFHEMYIQWNLCKFLSFIIYLFSIHIQWIDYYSGPILPTAI